MSSGSQVPPEGAVWMDKNHAYTLAYFKGELAGLNEFHWTGERWCCGFAAFKEYNPQHFWEVLSVEPLTLSPSLLCRACGNHGWIRDGKWVKA